MSATLLWLGTSGLICRWYRIRCRVKMATTCISNLLFLAFSKCILRKYSNCSDIAITPLENKSQKHNSLLLVTSYPSQVRLNLLLTPFPKLPSLTPLPPCLRQIRFQSRYAPEGNHSALVSNTPTHTRHPDKPTYPIHSPSTPPPPAPTQRTTPYTRHSPADRKKVSQTTKSPHRAAAAPN